MKKPTVTAGEIYGRLTVIREDGRIHGSNRAYLCQCECGATTRVAGYCLRDGNTQSCGCLRRDRATERRLAHGHTVSLSRTPTYETWRGMVRRCKPDAREREWYSDRGIHVCDRWLGKGGFSNFLADMGERPHGMTIDRIDCDGNYEPGNCRWATNAAQQLNKRTRARLSDVASLKAKVVEQQREIERLRSGVIGLD